MKYLRIDANGVTGELNDLWKFDPKLGSNGEWAWMGGSRPHLQMFPEDDSAL
jgi:hypothetical protein